MPDYSMCAQSGCPKADKCARFLAEPNPYRQSYFAPVFGENGCNEFWDVREGVPFKLREPKKETTT